MSINSVSGTTLELGDPIKTIDRITVKRPKEPKDLLLWKAAFGKLSEKDSYTAGDPGFEKVRKKASPGDEEVLEISDTDTFLRCSRLLKRKVELQLGELENLVVASRCDDVFDWASKTAEACLAFKRKHILTLNPEQRKDLCELMREFASDLTALGPFTVKEGKTGRKGVRNLQRFIASCEAIGIECPSAKLKKDGESAIISFNFNPSESSS